MEEERIRLPHLDIREPVSGKAPSRYGIRIKGRSEVSYRIDVLSAVLRDPLL